MTLSDTQNFYVFSMQNLLIHKDIWESLACKASLFYMKKITFFYQKLFWQNVFYFFHSQVIISITYNSYNFTKTNIYEITEMFPLFTGIPSSVIHWISSSRNTLCFKFISLKHNIKHSHTFLTFWYILKLWK